jgi:hypothetical protein
MHSRVWGAVDFWSPLHPNHFNPDPLGLHIQDLRPWVLGVLVTTDFVRGYLHSGPSALGILGSAYPGLQLFGAHGVWDYSDLRPSAFLYALRLPNSVKHSFDSHGLEFWWHI